MQTTAVDAIDAKKQEIGKQMFNPNAPEEENPEEETPTAEAQPETPEETTDETDQEEIESAKVVITEGKNGKKTILSKVSSCKVQSKIATEECIQWKHWVEKLLNTTSLTFQKVAHLVNWVILMVLPLTSTACLT